MENVKLSDYAVQVNGQRISVETCPVASYAAFALSGRTEITVTPRILRGMPIIRPLSRNVQIAAEAEAFQFTLDSPQNLYLELEGLPPLYLFANPVQENTPDPNDPNVLFFAAGQVHDAGKIELKSNQTLYLEAGAVVRGSIHAAGAENIRVCGQGILDGSHYENGAPRLVVFEECRNVIVEGIITAGTPSWNVVFGRCDRVHVDNIKLIGWVVSSDGIDVVGSRNVHIENCFLRNNDDCVVVKSVSYDDRVNDSLTDWRGDVDTVLVERCVLYNAEAGNALEIGFETQAESIRNITFRDCDVIGAHGEGGVFTIHNGDRATISDILYEDIRVEHFYDKLIDFRIMHSRYSKDTERGKIRNVHFRHIHTIADRFNTISLMGGYDEDHGIENVVIEDFVMGTQKITSLDDLNLYVKHANGIEFR